MQRRNLPEIVMDAWQPEEVKMVLVVNTELKMGVGKIAAQCGHGALACYKLGVEEQPRVVAAWERAGQKKGVVRGGGEEALVNLGRAARMARLVVAEVRDAGRSQVKYLLRFCGKFETMLNLRWRRAVSPLWGSDQVKSKRLIILSGNSNFCDIADSLRLSIYVHL